MKVPPGILFGGPCIGWAVGRIAVVARGKLLRTTLCLRASSYDGGDVVEAFVGAELAAAREPLGRNSPMHGVGCRGKDELGDSPSEERVSVPLSELTTANKRDNCNKLGL
jgi:hypothetical protein